MHIVVVLSQKAHDAVAQVEGHMLLGNVAAHVADLPRLLGSHPVQMHHVRRNAREQGGEYDHGQQDYANGESALWNVSRHHFHGSRCKLRHTPMHCSGVDVRHLWFTTNLSGELCDPTLSRIAAIACLRLAHAIPTASNVVVDQHDAAYELGDAKQRRHLLREDLLAQVPDDGENFRCAGESEQSHHTQDAEQANRFVQAENAEAVSLHGAVQNHHRPIADDHYDVGGEPSLDIVQCYPPRPHLEETTEMISAKEGKYDVKRPERGRYQIDRVSFAAALHLEELQRDHDQIVAHSKYAQNIPSDAAWGGWPCDHSLPARVRAQSITGAQVLGAQDVLAIIVKKPSR
mmetsp:Transcript_20534/g.59515  ORF Transcript_20534/g.59515 Transcript_20534/m.59515 type:complete len:346 (-) Transcript_20534:632-1669(-)